LYNNTVYGNAGGLQIYSNTGAVVTNNVFSSTGAFDVAQAGSPVGFSDNLCDAAETGCTAISDPRFVDAAGADFHLQPTSPAIDAGAAVSDVRTDFDGVSRPQGAAYDIGAYEYH